MSERITIFDGYADQPTSQRSRLIEEVRRLKVMLLSDPSDPELRDRIADAEEALRALDARGAR
jgi:hypothetical protein